MTAGIKANVDGSAAIQVGGTDVITLTSGGAATFVTSPTTVQAGTAAAPSITTSGDTNTGIFFPAADTIAFAEGGVEALRINSSGTVVLSGGDTSANGTGITFPATQSASSNANTLDDYEEGTWTPVFRDGIAGTAATAATSFGSYTKIGNVVTYRILLQDVNRSGLTAGNTVHITGFPFTSSNASSGAEMDAIATVNSATPTTGCVTLNVQSNATYGLLVNQTTTGQAVFTVSQTTSGSFDLFVTGTYFV